MNHTTKWNIPCDMYDHEKSEKWDFCPEPYQDEAFLSWFVRLAKGNCSDPRLLYIQLAKSSSLHNGNLEFISGKLIKAQLNKKDQEEILIALNPFIPTQNIIFESSLYSLLRFKDPLSFLNVPLKSPRFCPQCLKQDKTPYFRDNWFFKPFLVCPIHHCFLFENCPHCSAEIKFWNTGWQFDNIFCSECGQSILDDIFDTITLQNLDYYALIEQAFGIYGKNHQGSDKTVFLHDLWESIFKSSKDSLITHVNHVDSIVPRENLFRAIIIELKNIVNNEKNRNSRFLDDNEKVGKEYSIENSDLIENCVSRNDLAVAKNRLEIITPLIKNKHRSHEDLKIQAVKTGTCSRTLYRWIKSYTQDGIEGLIPKFNKCGRKQVKFTSEIDLFVEKWVDEYVSNSDEHRMVDCWNHLNEDAKICGFMSSQLPKKAAFNSRCISKLNKNVKSKKLQII